MPSPAEYALSKVSLGQLQDSTLCENLDLAGVLSCVLSPESPRHLFISPKAFLKELR